MNFHFLRPWCFLALLPACVIAFLLFKQQASQGAWHKVIAPNFLPFLLSQKTQKKARPVAALAFSAWLIAVFALAGPTYTRVPTPLMQNQHSLVVVLNLSKSMDTQDVTPSRLERAKLKLKDILQQRADGLTGLVVFAGDAHVVTPLSSDTATIEAMISSLNSSIMPISGNNTILGLEKAQSLLSAVGGKDILLISDGLDEEQGQEIKLFVKKTGLKISVMGIGTEQGGPILDETGAFLKDESGQVFMSQADLKSLQQLAKESGGNYLSAASSEQELKDFLSQNDAVSVQDAKSEHFFDEWHDLGCYFTLALLPFALILFRRGLLFALLLFFFCGYTQAGTFGDFFLNKNQRGFAAFKQKNYSEAAKLFSDSQWQGSAEYESKNYDKAAKHFAASKNSDALYNLGNSLALQGKIDDALKAYDNALAIDANNKDAQFNKEVLEKLKKQQEQQKQEQEQKQQDKKAEAEQSQEKEQGKDKKEEEKQALQNQEQKEKPAQDEQKAMQVDQATQEEKMALEQMLRRIPDDPGGLLKRKFYLESLKNERKSGER